MYRNDRIERARLHKLWITELDRPCSKCGSSERREIAHIIPYHQGGKTTEDNCRVLCRQCNLAENHNSKFLVGDRVVLNGRTPARIELKRHRPRTIIGIRYDINKKCNYYLLGSNGRGACADGQPLNGYDYEFRSYMLVYPRHYHYKRQYQIQSTCDTQGTSDNYLISDKLSTSFGFGIESSRIPPGVSKRLNCNGCNKGT